MILQIIANAPAETLYNVLFDLLIYAKTQNPVVKYHGLVVKCILKLTKEIEKIKNSINLEQIIWKMNAYLHIEDIKRNPDDIGQKTIKTMLNEMVKFLEAERLQLLIQLIEQAGNWQMKKWVENFVAQQEKALGSGGQGHGPGYTHGQQQGHHGQGNPNSGVRVNFSGANPK
jgi:hypothetical protein